MSVRKPLVIGAVFGRLTVLSSCDEVTPNGRVWLCQCACGKTKRVVQRQLRRGLTRSCGCLAHESRVAAGKRLNYHHGKWGTRVHAAWRWMIARGSAPICERWQTFEHFDTDMGDPPEGTELGRLNPAEGYNPENCRWMTRREHYLVTGGTLLIDRGGVIYPVAEWALITGLEANTIRARIKAGWDAERALTTPARAHRRKA